MIKKLFVVTVAAVIYMLTSGQIAADSGKTGTEMTETTLRYVYFIKPGAFPYVLVDLDCEISETKLALAAAVMSILVNDLGYDLLLGDLPFGRLTGIKPKKPLLVFSYNDNDSMIVDVYAPDDYDYKFLKSIDVQSAISLIANIEQ